MRIGIDLGGTKIEAMALDAGGRARARVRMATPRGDYQATLAAIAEVVGALERQGGTRATVGVGMPGAISPATGLVKNANSVWLNGTPFAVDLAARLDRPVRIANDANCFALSEATDGAGAEAPVVFGVIVGTGTGAGIVADGRVLTGPNAIAGEWGHNPMPWPRPDEHPGPPCYCGRSGCIETFLSGPGVARAYRETTGRAAEAPAIEAAARSGDAGAERTLAAYEERMARALASVINVLDPDVIVLGGGMSNLARLYTSVPRLWTPFVFSDHVATRLVPPRHGDASGARGAAWLWREDECPPSSFPVP
jgi:fructokinase